MEISNYNPYLHQGDIVHIPYKENFVTIKGGVQKPGKYEYKNIDFVIDAIIIAGGLNNTKYIENITIARSKSDQTISA